MFSHIEPAGPDALALHLEQTRREAAQRRWRRDLVLLLGFGVVIAISLVIAEVDPLRLARGFPQLFSYFARITPSLELATLPRDVGEWFWRWPVWLRGMLETILVAALATVFSAVGAALLCFAAARGLVPAVVSFITRRLLEFFRTVPELVFALLFVFAFGIGPMAGFLALAVHGTGSLGKLFSEVAEAADRGPLEALASMGGSWPSRMRYGVLPQVLPNMASYTMLSLENNVRSATVVGLVGGGGIGQELLFAIKQFQYTDVSALLVMIVTSVVVIDIISQWIRRRLIEGKATANA